MYTITLIILIAKKTEAIRIEPALICNRINYNYKNIIDTCNNLIDTADSWTSFNKLQFQDQIAIFKDRPIFLVQGDDLESLARDCNELKGNLVEAHSSQEMTEIGLIMKQNNIKAIAFHLKYNQETLWWTNGVPFYTNSVESSIKGNENAYHDLVEFTPYLDNQDDNPKPFRALDNTSGAKSLCLRRTNKLSRQFQDFKSDIWSTMLQFYDKHPNITELRDSIIDATSTNDTDETDAQECWKAVINPIENITFMKPIKLSDSKSLYKNLKRFKQFMSQAHSVQTNMKKIMAIVSNYDDIDISIIAQNIKYFFYKIRTPHIVAISSSVICLILMVITFFICRSCYRYRNAPPVQIHHFNNQEMVPLGMM